MNFTIQNMVGLADLRFPIRLEGVQLANEQMTQLVSMGIFLF